MSKHALFTLALALVAGLAATAPDLGHARALNQTVSHAGIDVGTPAGRAAIDAKVKRLAQRFCIDPNAPLAARQAQRDCVASVVADARPRIEQAAAQDRAARLAILNR